MYAGVPTAPRVTVSWIRSAALATPKSMTRGPSGDTSTLDGFRSRCISPAPWIDSSAAAHPAAGHRTAGTGSGPQVRTRRLSAGAGTYAVASQGTSASGSAATTAAVNAPPRGREAEIDLSHRARAQAPNEDLTANLLRVLPAKRLNERRL